MIVINTKTAKAYENVSKSEAGRIVGVCRETIHRWSKDKKMEVYNHFVLFFDVEKKNRRRIKDAEKE